LSAEPPVSADVNSHRPDARWVRRSFDRAAATYDAAAVLQAQVRDVLLERLDLTRLEPRVVLDLGAATGQGARALKQRYPGARVIAVDSSARMLRLARRRRPWFRPSFALLRADAQRLPLADASVDVAFSNLLLPWCDPDALFAELRRVLAPRGLLTLTGLGPDTLKELRAAWAAADTHIRVGAFIDMHDLGDGLVRAGFAAPVLDVERYTLRYADVHGLTADLKAMGTRNAAVGRLKGLTSPRKLAAMQTAYEGYREGGRLPATCEVVFAQAWAPLETRVRATSAQAVSLEALREQLAVRRRR
jgi:malonyl-CoA O-methyltransferase